MLNTPETRKTYAYCYARKAGLRKAQAWAFGSWFIDDNQFEKHRGDVGIAWIKWRANGA